MGSTTGHIQPLCQSRSYSVDVFEDAAGAAGQRVFSRSSLPVDEVALQSISRAYDDDRAYDASERKHSGLRPVYEDEAVVEYFSPTHKIWLVGAIHLSIEKSKKWTGNPVFVYNVRVKKSGQMRNRVPVDMLRPPLEPTELVEVFSKRNTGQWMFGTIRGPKAGGNIMKGYKVFLESQAGVAEMLLENVPSWRIRRRFPARSSIEVYRGMVLGWVKAVVHSVITAFPAEPPIPISPWSPGTSADAERENTLQDLPGVRAPPVHDEATSWQREDAETMCGSTVIGEDNMGVHPWVQVPVYVEEWDEEEWGRDPDVERAQWVPSYLIRMRMIQLASSKGYERRSFMT